MYAFCSAWGCTGVYSRRISVIAAYSRQTGADRQHLITAADLHRYKHFTRLFVLNRQLFNGRINHQTPKNKKKKPIEKKVKTIQPSRFHTQHPHIRTTLYPHAYKYK